MKKKFNIKNLECANCANKMQEAIKKIDGVNDVNINFVMQKIIIDAKDEIFNDILKKANDICKNIERHCFIEF